ncbi:hypothetical protein ACQ4M4_02320 [Leptolyngbya sp. AN02str]|uniref:hypothetical protein n=1 Tax=Leptolyngbya sp. AN02str TaxID=3423363 RepID=UPI003D30F612
MSLLVSLVRSLILTSLLAFLAPVLLIGVVLLGFQGLALVPPLQALGQLGSQQIVSFLMVFGNGDPYEGLLLIGAVCGLVGLLFDTYNIYRHQHFRHTRDRH